MVHFTWLSLHSPYKLRTFATKMSWLIEKLLTWDSKPILLLPPHLREMLKNHRKGIH